ncbi:hypothetical protein HOC06_01360 [Candidatus Woesearchaeota archaeon]|jgi:hypothetical protein|nr:hypothetical protein [Candidatus Woesearchaeota archaeon]
MKKVLFWLPRILTIIFILFISVFSLDVFSEYSGLELLLALFMHLIPSLILTALLVVAWKWEKIGGILFILLGIGFFIFFSGYDMQIGALITTLPALVVGILFLINYYKN